MLDRDLIKKTLGAKEAQRYTTALRANDKNYPQRNFYAIRLESKGNRGVAEPAADAASSAAAAQLKLGTVVTASTTRTAKKGKVAPAKKNAAATKT